MNPNPNPQYPFKPSCQNCAKVAEYYDGFYWYCSKACEKQHSWEMEQYHNYLTYGVED